MYMWVEFIYCRKEKSHTNLSLDKLQSTLLWSFRARLDDFPMQISLTLTSLFFLTEIIIQIYAILIFL